MVWRLGTMDLIYTWMLFKLAKKQKKIPLLLVFEMLDGTQTLEGSIDHYGQSSAEGLALLHTRGKQP